MKFKILSDGILVNTIVANEQFCSQYCEKNGYTYEVVAEPESEPVTLDEPTTEEILDVLLGVTTNE